jgi:hypothetical protein
LVSVVHSIPPGGRVTSRKIDRHEAVKCDSCVALRRELLLITDHGNGALLRDRRNEPEFKGVHHHLMTKPRDVLG